MSHSKPFALDYMLRDDGLKRRHGPNGMRLQSDAFAGCALVGPEHQGVAHHGYRDGQGRIFDQPASIPARSQANAPSIHAL